MHPSSRRGGIARAAPRRPVRGAAVLNEQLHLRVGTRSSIARDKGEGQWSSTVSCDEAGNRFRLSHSAPRHLANGRADS
eukprot:6646882-Prymnesium_polylepis.1